jgi:tRNA pseudouridine38-40 synthase
MNRICLVIEFDGSAFCGWQKQSKKHECEFKPSIQSCIQNAIQIILKSPNEVHVQGCGRTDAGVHAEEFYCHFDIETNSSHLDLEKFRHSLNALVPPQISVIKCYQAAPHFHAIDDINTKIYRYQIFLRRSKPTHHAARFWWLPVNIEEFSVEKLTKASHYFLGKHDFFAFSASNSQTKTSLREIISINTSLKPYRDQPCFGYELQLEVEGRGFLKHMVRLMVGTLVEIAQSKREPSFIKECLSLKHERNYTLLPPLLCAPSHALTLIKINYNEK